MRTLLPTVHQKVGSVPVNKRTYNLSRYNEGADELKPLQSGETVRIHSKERRDWTKKGKIVKKLDQPRSYDVINENGNVIRRNQRALIPTKEVFKPACNQDEVISSDSNCDNREKDEEIRDNEPKETPLNAKDLREHTYSDISDEEPYRNRLRQSVRRPERYGYE